MWDTGVVDVSAPWWSDDWYRGVGIGPESAVAFRGLGWEPPLAAFMRRWGGGLKAGTLKSRFSGVPVGLLRRVWREGLRGPGAAQKGLSTAVDWLSAEVTGAWLDRFGTVGTVGLLVSSGLSPEILERCDAAWPDHGLFRWADALDADKLAGAAGWLNVAVATQRPSEVPHPDAHLGVPSLLPGLVTDFLAAGVQDPAEAMTMMESGVDSDTLRMMSALRG